MNGCELARLVLEETHTAFTDAAAITLLMLSRSLHCRMEDLMEYVHI